MKRLISGVNMCGVLLIGQFANGVARAEGKACILGGAFELSGQLVVISQCLENRDMAEKLFREVCEGMSVYSLAGATHKVKYEFSASCPSNPQGTCEGTFGGALNEHYYNPDPEILESTKETCSLQMGNWK